MKNTLMFDAISHIDEAKLDKCLNEEQSYIRKQQEKQRITHRWTLAAAFCAVVAFLFIALTTSGIMPFRKGMSGSQKEKQKRFSTIAAAEALLGTDFLFSRYSGENYSTEIILTYLADGNENDRSGWIKVDCFMEKQDQRVLITEYLAELNDTNAYMGKVDPDNCAKVVLNNNPGSENVYGGEKLEVTFSVYDDKSGNKQGANALTACFDAGGKHYVIEYTQDEPIESAERLLSELLN